MRVIQTIQSPVLDAGRPVEVVFYTGDDRAAAIAAAASASVVTDNQYYKILSVRTEFDG